MTAHSQCVPPAACSVFSPPAVPTGSTNSRAIRWKGLGGCADALAIAATAEHNDQLILVITPDSHTAHRLERELRFFLAPNLSVFAFPDWETLPYDWFSPLPQIVSDRLNALVALSTKTRAVLLVAASTSMQRLAPRQHVFANTFRFTVGARLDLHDLRDRLDQVGYQCVAQVFQHGEFAVRGSILDLFPMGSDTALRIEFFDNEVDSMRAFDPETQRSLHKLDSIELIPAREFPFDDDSIKRFRRAFRAEFPEYSIKSTLYQDISKAICPAGAEFYLPLFVEQTETLFDYLPANSQVVIYQGSELAAENFYREVEERYAQRCHDQDRPVLAPERLYLDTDAWRSRLNTYPRTVIEHSISSEVSHTDGEITMEFGTQNLPNLVIQPRHKEPAENLLTFLRDFPGRVLFVAETPGHRESLRGMLEKYAIHAKLLHTWSEFIQQPVPRALIIAPLDQGLLTNDPAIAIITETLLSGEKVQQRRRRKVSDQSAESLLRDLSELQIGAPVVHQEHGVGRYLGLQRLVVGGIDAEFLTIEYAANDKLYVPVAGLHLISPYIGVNPENAPLHKLGNEQWKKLKRRTLEKLRDVAAELLSTQAKRAAHHGHAYPISEEEYAAFAAAFPFEETADQEATIDQVLSDLAREQPMDRVVCGDVGFGKTEVAMRAAFVAVSNHRQVAVLVPTTLLAQQHWQNFCDRFADWPVRIESLSRFVGRKQQNAILEALTEGKVDILIGTHRVLQKDVRFKNLGLVIVDEEHRFGVRQKEYLKKLRNEVDLLTLTATPIPRTLNMALAGVRDISIIATPPTNRHPIKTFVSEWRDALVQEACRREILRGGQVYFVHNEIETLAKIAESVSALVPEARIRIAHGQMPERELEQVMLDFYHQRFNLLLCTTIIESGIDVPTANTMVINRADLLGLAQLHQLRGRVGRSHHRAYAYLITPPAKLMTADAVKRLKAIEAAGELGAGFTLASYDLEIRGAGALLGEEQSGEMQEIGYTLYTELLERTVKALQAGREIDLDSPLELGAEVDLQIPCLIPDEYLADIHARLVLYNRISSAATPADLDALQVEMIDRFGLLPEPAKNLFAAAALKLTAVALGIQKIETGAYGGRLLFGAQPQINTAKLIQLVQTQGAIYKLQGQQSLRFTQPLDAPRQRIDFVAALLEQLRPD